MPEPKSPSNHQRVTTSDTDDIDPVVDQQVGHTHADQYIVAAHRSPLIYRACFNLSQSCVHRVVAKCTPN